jgi:ABC-type uncharacterized transport system auxiliary subunit
MIAQCLLPVVPARLALLACIVFVAGCSFTREPPVKKIYLVDAPPPPAAAKAHPAALRVGTVRVSLPYRGRNIVVREGEYRYQNDFYLEFLVPPGPMLTEQTARALAAARVFARVVPPGAYGEADYVLDGFVSEMYADVRGDTKVAAVVDVMYYLRNANSANEVPFWSQEYKQSVTVSGPTTEAYAAAVNSAWGAIFADLAKDLAAATLPKP